MNLLPTYQHNWVPKATLIVLLLVALGCSTVRRQHQHDQTGPSEDSGDMIAYVSPSRGMALFATGSRGAADLQAGLLQTQAQSQRPSTRAVINQFAEFPSSSHLASFVLQYLDPIPGDRRVYTNAYCAPAPHPCNTNCHSIVYTNTLPPTVTHMRDQILVTNYLACKRTNAPVSCTAEYQQICIRTIFKDPDCVETNLVFPVHGWNCAGN